MRHNRSSRVTREWRGCGNDNLRQPAKKPMRGHVSCFPVVYVPTTGLSVVLVMMVIATAILLDIDGFAAAFLVCSRGAAQQMAK
jgi:hypothetical protein